MVAKDKNILVAQYWLQELFQSVAYILFSNIKLLDPEDTSKAG